MRNSLPPAATTSRPSERGPATSKTCGIESASGQTMGPDAPPMTIAIAAISKITCSPDETPILAHHQLRLQLPHRVEGDADHDQDRCAAEIHLLLGYARDLVGGDGQDHGNEAQEGGACEGDAIHHSGQI